MEDEFYEKMNETNNLNEDEIENLQNDLCEKENEMNNAI